MFSIRGKGLLGIWTIILIAAHAATVSTVAKGSSLPGRAPAVENLPTQSFQKALIKESTSSYNKKAYII